LVTLAGLGGAVWMFLSGGGLSQLAAPGAGGQPVAGVGVGSPTGWNSGAPTYAPAPGLPALQPTAVGATAPPLGNGPTIRIAAFNIQVFGKSKSEDPRVMYTLAEIVRQFHVVAIQEIRTQDDRHMQGFVQLINSTGRKFDFCIGPRIGNTRSTEQYAFVFDTEQIMLDRNSVFTVGDPDNLLHREPLVASFSTRMPPDSAFTFTLVNVHTDPGPEPEVLPAELAALAEVYREVRRTGRGEDDIIMLGDFNADDEYITKQTRLGKIPGVTPLVRGRGVFSNTRQNELYDNLVVHLPSTTEYVGRSGVFNFGQQFNLSPHEAEQVSDHFPVWAEFSAYERDYTGRIASRGTSAR
jgi:endonuclease/exonuclease/phosphatase family metal-dependent hydrolase